MPAAQQLARDALAARRRADDDPLVQTLDPLQRAAVLRDLARGAKGEFRGPRPRLQAPWSSTAFTASLFGAWVGRPELDVVRFEERLHIPHGGGTPNLDVWLEADGAPVGVEVKLTEHLAARTPRPWKAPYRRPSMLAELDGGWAAVFAAALDGTFAPRHLDVPQLIRHALSLAPRHAHAVLAYVFWQPVLPAHVAALRERYAVTL